MNISSIKSNDLSGFLRYGISPDVTAFSPLRDAVLPMPVVQAHQVHGDRVAVVRSAALTREDLDGFDALITDVPGVAVGARTADCIPVLMYDPVHRAVAAVHSGWKGTVLKIAAKTLAAMSGEFGTRPADILAVIGPGIGPDSFQVGPEVARAFLDAGFPEAGLSGIYSSDRPIISDRGPRIPGTMQGGLHIDLWEAVRLTLFRAGVPDSHILTAGRQPYPHRRHRHLHPPRLLLRPPRRPLLRTHRQHNHAQSVNLLMSADLPTPMPADYSCHNGTKSRESLPLRNEA